MEKTKITVPNGTRDLIFEEVTAERELEGRIDGLLDVLGYRRCARRLWNTTICSTRATAISMKRRCISSPTATAV